MTESIPARGRLAALRFALPVAITALLVRGLQLLTPSEFWWHVTVGEVIATFRRIPDTQLFVLFADADQPWIYSSWLGDLILAELTALGGAGLPLLLHNLSVALTAGILAFFLARRFHPHLAVLLPCLVAAVALAVFTGVTPWSLAMPVTAVALVAATHLLSRPSAPLAALLPATTILVVNIDLTTAAIIALVGLATAFALFRNQNTLPATIAATSPLGLLFFAYGPTAFVAALQYPEPAALTAPAILLITIAAAHLLARRFTNVGWRIPKGAAAIFWILVGIAAVAIQPGVPTRAPILTTLRSDARPSPPLAGAIADDMPIRCAETLRDTGKEIRLFAQGRYAGLLLYHVLDPAAPRPILLHDHRRLLTAEQNDLLRLLPTEPIARGIFQQQAVNAAVVSTEDYPALINDLQISPDWHDLQDDPDAPVRCFLHLR